MQLEEKIDVLVNLGKIMKAIGTESEWPGYEIGINQEEYEALNTLVNQTHIYNGWFTPAAVRSAFTGIASWLNKEELKNWSENYPKLKGKSKTIAIIMAGNIPLVGFHDLLVILLSGHKAMVKLSSDDNRLLPALIKTASLFNPSINDWVEFKDQKIENFDAVIATGSDNSANYFHTYFGKYPHIIRKNRTSIAVLNGDETKEELTKLGEDVFTYFGLGCRNVSQIWVPKNFEVDRIFEAFFAFKEIANHNKYANNYDYNRAVYLLNLEDMLDNGFLLLKEDKNLNSPIGMLHIARYEDQNEIEEFITAHSDKIQVVVGKNYVPFGTAQYPKLTDYADGIDTFSFVTNL